MLEIGTSGLRGKERRAGEETVVDLPEINPTHRHWGLSFAVGESCPSIAALEPHGMQGPIFPSSSAVRSPKVDKYKSSLLY